ncbi:THUMP domain-containing class I SAM-dependent RNA methyltransferase [Haloplasma contractile]|uniref:N6-adenine-specific DNA methylase DNA replication protein n=1 Tax=Haloplasma contractile SSD-17B TaxID=1033810 RepID=U2FK09_9MOLU|nr:class I SAM-dependent RNA methyltransferase [Haloplasma contractile]ERJ13150.1 putative N6-adenine-specific DNA methylase DNA replication protein [Haloplasma contractile SSD-17B]
MKQIELIATTTFGLESVVKREVKDLGFRVKSVEDGKITFFSDLAGIAKANLWLRSADRVLLKIGEFKAYTFDELFEQTKTLPWGDFIPVDGKFTVNGKSVKSKLFSISDCQAIVKKSVVENLKKKYNVEWFEETGAEFTIQVSLLKDLATLTIDTSGVGLHKRGYRQQNVEAPIKETLAAALINLSFWNKDRVLYDVFCGSGTIPIEAAMIARNIAPGLLRDFASTHWEIMDGIWKSEIKKAKQAIDQDSEIKIYASDIDPKAIESAQENAFEAAVDDCITFSVSDFKDIDYSEDYAVLISNPPYGERLKDKEEVEQITRDMGKIFNKLDTWSKYIITSLDGFEYLYKKKADRERKLFNGRIKVRYYQYYGPRPPRD